MHMGKALYREYRPHTLAEVAGQPHITNALERSLKSGVISHAFLFTGPRGVGKTSVARILAYQVNNLPYDDTSNHLDIIEIDAASNRGIEDVRELRDKVAVAPTSAKYKVYIIDEVHMLTTPAFNALLKTLEEPPAHVIFILATTEAHKLPETIISRTQHYAFRPISIDSIVVHLRKIADSEHIQIDNEALEVLASHGGGSFRDSIGLLDQVRHSSDSITADDVRSVFGIAPAGTIRAVIDAISIHDAAAVYAALTSSREQGIAAASLAAQLAHTIRDDLKHSTGTLTPKVALELLSNLISVAPSPNPEISLEVLLIGASLRDAPEIQQTNVATTNTPKQQPVVDKPAIVLPVSKQDTMPSADKPTKEIEHTSVELPAVLPKDSSFETIWQETLMHIKKTHHSLYGVLRMAEVALNDNKVLLQFRFKIHHAKVNDPNNIETIVKALLQITGVTYPVVCSLSDSTVKAAIKSPSKSIDTTQPDAQNGALSTISNIFGGGELLES